MMTFPGEAVAASRVLVVGDVMLDRYWFGDVDRISPEAPVPVVKMGRVEDRLGGAANVARNIAALGAQASLLGVIGQDEAGKTLAESELMYGDELEQPVAWKAGEVAAHAGKPVRLRFADGFTYPGLVT